MRTNNHVSRRGSKRSRWSWYAFYGFVCLVFSPLLLGLLLFFYYSRNLPDFKPLKERNPNAYSVVYSEQDEVVARFLINNRIPVSYEKIPERLIQAFIAAEDADFFHHKGVDYKSILRAVFKNLTAGRVVQGGSTITQQVTKTFFLTPKRSLLRKLKEAAYAFGLERNLTKKEILSLYLNNIYLGNGAYGVEAASESYFNKRTEQLDLAEMALMAGLVKAPSRYSPVNNLHRAKNRQGYVLNRMLELGFISPEQKERALRYPLRLQSKESAFFSKAPYYTEFLRQQIEKKYGKDVLYGEGLRIYTSLDLSLQKAAERAVERGLRELDKREGFRGPLETLETGALKALLDKKPSSIPLPQGEIFEATVISKDENKKLYTVWVEDRKGLLPFSEMEWALHVKPTGNYKPQKVKTPADLLQPGDTIYVKVKDISRKEQPPLLSLEQEPLVQGALICIDPRTGDVKAMVGGREFTESQFNRAINSRRQPGSAFKPLIYAAALEKGYTPSSIIMDSPVEFSDPDGGTYWAPENYDKDFLGPITFRNGLVHSRNVVTVKILEDIGLGYALKFIKKLGIESPIKRDLSIALGTSGVSMLELTSAFAVFPNGGERVRPVFINKIVTMKGEVLEEGVSSVESEELEEEEEASSAQPLPPQNERVLSPQLAYIMTHLLEGVVVHGTGQRAKVLGRPVGGKTGTSSDYADAWFIGFTPSLLATVWVGFDDEASLGKNETGARTALPIWISFMQQALSNKEVEAFKVPEGVKLIRVNIETGLPTEEASPDDLLEAFLEDTVPESNSDLEKKFGPLTSPPRNEGVTYPQWPY